MVTLAAAMRGGVSAGGVDRLAVLVTEPAAVAATVPVTVMTTGSGTPVRVTMPGTTPTSQRTC